MKKLICSKCGNDEFKIVSKIYVIDGRKEKRYKKGETTLSGKEVSFTTYDYFKCSKCDYSNLKNDGLKLAEGL